MLQQKRTPVTFLILSAGYILLGLLAFIVPNSSNLVVCYLLGAITVLCGLIRITFFFVKDEATRLLRNDLPFGILFLIVGIYLIARPEIVWAWLPVLLGFVIVFDSILRMQEAFLLKQTGFTFWWGVLIAAVITVVFGSLLILGSFTGMPLLYFFASSLLANGIFNLATFAIGWFQNKKAAAD